MISGSKKGKRGERPRGTDNDESRLILIMESGAGETLNFPAGVCLPSLFLFFFSMRSPPCLSRFGPVGPCRFDFASSLYLSAHPLLF